MEHPVSLQMITNVSNKLPILYVFMISTSENKKSEHLPLTSSCPQIHMVNMYDFPPSIQSKAWRLNTIEFQIWKCLW